MSFSIVSTQFKHQAFYSRQFSTEQFLFHLFTRRFEKKNCTTTFFGQPKPTDDKMQSRIEFSPVKNFDVPFWCRVSLPVLLLKGVNSFSRTKSSRLRRSEREREREWKRVSEWSGDGDAKMLSADTLAHYIRLHGQQYNTLRVSQLFCIGIGLHKNVCSAKRHFREMRIFETPSSQCYRAHNTTIRYQQVKYKRNISMDPPSLSFIFEDEFLFVVVARAEFLRWIFNLICNFLSDTLTEWNLFELCLGRTRAPGHQQFISFH